jgi:hypothetical protein
VRSTVCSLYLSHRNRPVLRFVRWGVPTSRWLRQRSRYCYVHLKALSIVERSSLFTPMQRPLHVGSRSFFNNSIGLCLNNTRSYLSFLLVGLSTNRHSLCGSRSPSPCWLLPAMHLAWPRRTNTETRTLDNQDTCEQSSAGESVLWSC